MALRTRWRSKRFSRSDPPSVRPGCATPFANSSRARKDDHRKDEVIIRLSNSHRREPFPARCHLAHVIECIPREFIGLRTRGLSGYARRLCSNRSGLIAPQPRARLPEPTSVNLHFGNDVYAMRPLPREFGHSAAGGVRRSCFCIWVRARSARSCAASALRCTPLGVCAD